MRDFVGVCPRDGDGALHSAVGMAGDGADVAKPAAGTTTSPVAVSAGLGVDDRAIGEGEVVEPRRR